MSSVRDQSAEDTSVTEIVNTRHFAASAAACFAAFRDPARLSRWWGPAGFTNVVPEFDFRPGGRWRIIMRDPDGKEYPNESEFLEIVPDARIRFLHLGPMHRYWLTMDYAPDAGGCRLTWHMRFATIAEYAKVKDFVFAGNEQNSIGWLPAWPDLCPKPHPPFVETLKTTSDPCQPCLVKRHRPPPRMKLS